MKPLACLALLFLLSACTTDPYAMIAQGNALIASQERARLEQERAAELEAAQARDAAEWEIAQIQAASAATLSAWDMTITQADATMAAGRTTATAAAMQIQTTLTAIPIQATMTAIPIQATASYMDAQRRETMAMVQMSIIGLSIAAIAFIVIMFLWSLSKWIPQWIDMRRRVVATGIHLVGWMWDEDGDRVPVVLAGDGVNSSNRWKPPTLALPQTVPDVIVSRAGITATSTQPMTPGLNLRALAIIEESIKHYGGSSNMLVGYREAGMGGSTWTRAISSLKAINMVEKTSEGYVLTEKYQSLVEVVEAIKSGRLHVPTVPNDRDAEDEQINSYIEDEADRLQKEGFFKVTE